MKHSWLLPSFSSLATENESFNRCHIQKAWQHSLACIHTCANQAVQGLVCCDGRSVKIQQLAQVQMQPAWLLPSFSTLATETESFNSCYIQKAWQHPLVCIHTCASMPCKPLSVVMDALSRYSSWHKCRCSLHGCC